MKSIARPFMLMLALTLLPATSKFIPLYSQDYVTPDFRVSDSSGYNYQTPQLSVSLSGDMAVIWETSGGGRLPLKTIHEQGTTMSDEQLLTSTFYTNVTRIAHAGNGNCLVLYGGYVSEWQAFAQIFDVQGNALSDTFRVNQNFQEMVQMYTSSVFPDHSNGFGVFLPGLDSMMVEKVTASGEFAGNTIILKPGTSSFYDLTGAMTLHGELVMVWKDLTSGNLFGRRFDPEGMSIGEAFQVSEKEEGSNIQQFILTCDTAGNFVVAWVLEKEGRKDLYAQLFDTNGTVIGTDTRITDEQAVYTNGVITAAMDLDGKYVVAWPDYRHNDTSYIYLQEVDNLGDPVGGNYRATSVNNNYTQDELNYPLQIDPSVRIVRDTIYLAWANYNQELSYRQEIFANIQKWQIAEVPERTISNSGPYEKIEAYPNPFTDYFKLKVSGLKDDIVVIQISNTMGQLVRYISEKPVTGEVFVSEITVPGPEGTYFLDIIAGDRTYIRKLLKMN